MQSLNFCQLINQNILLFGHYYSLINYNDIIYSPPFFKPYETKEVTQFPLLFPRYRRTIEKPITFVPVLPLPFDLRRLLYSVVFEVAA